MLELGDTLQGDTQFARSTDDSEFVVCGNSLGGEYSAPGIWYKVEGEGFPVQAAVFADFDVQLTVFSGASCDALVCVDGTEGTCHYIALVGFSYLVFADEHNTTFGLDTR